MITSNTKPRKLIPDIRQAAGSIVMLSILFILALISTPSAQAQTFTVLHEFSAGRDGANPTAGVVLDAAGNIYGVTWIGGSFNYGTVFEVDAAGKEKVLHSFLGGDGLYPVAGLMLDAAGNLYGTTEYGGTAEGGSCEHGCGTVFKLTPAGQQTVLYAFTGKRDGGGPSSALIHDAIGNLYGTGGGGGDPSCFGSGCGVIFKLNTANQENALYSFTGGTDGQMPAGIVRDAAGDFYGTTYDGGALGYGIVWKLDKSGAFSVFYSFTGGADSGDPKGPPIADKSGNLYGATYGVGEGLQGYGVVYKLDSAGNFTLLYTFNGTTDGQYPGGLVLDAEGNLYGTALGGGTGTGCYYGGCGTVFEVDAGGNFTVLHSFTGADGELPNGLIIDAAGNLYGTALGGGHATNKCYYGGCGTVFKLTP